MMDLYSSATANGQRARLVLEETRTPYRLHSLNLHAGEQASPAIRALNPLGAIPILVDPDGPDNKLLTLTQSIAIILYVAEKSKMLIPAEAGRRAAMWQWLSLAASDIAGTNSAINQLGRSAPEKSEQNIDFFEGRLLRYFEACNLQLASETFIAGEFSIADISLYPFVAARAGLMHKSGGLAHLKNWVDRMQSRPAIAIAMSH